VGLPGAWTVLLLRAVVVHPAGRDSPSPSFARAAVVFGPFNTLDTRDDLSFVAAFPTAHALARLRIAGRVTATVARLATGWAGSPFAGRASHPLDDVPNFIRFSSISLLSDQPCLVARRVAPEDFSPGALTRTGQGDFHHPAPPLGCLAATSPRSGS